MKNVVEFFKNPKKRALSQLVFYFIFFAFVFIIIESSDNKSNTNNDYSEFKEEQKEIIEEEKKYDYKYTFIINDLEIKGSYVNKNNIFIIDGVQYYSINGTTYKYETMEEVSSFDIDKYLYQHIEELINKSEFVEKTMYKDESEKITYSINDEKYCLDCTMIVEINKNINKVYIDDNIELSYIFKEETE